MAPEREEIAPLADFSRGNGPEPPLSFRQVEDESALSGRVMAEETASAPPCNAEDHSVERLQEEPEEGRDASQSARVVNIDERPIASKKKTFEELLEENLKQEQARGGVQREVKSATRPETAPELLDSKPKHDFLKRKTRPPTNPDSNKPKKYNYYADCFEENAGETGRASGPPRIQHSNSQHSLRSGGSR